jgi:glycosyltransferase involved in cell wall biosynthesis
MARRGYAHRVLTMASPGIPKDLEIADNVSVLSRRLPVLPITSKLEGYFGLVGAWAKASLAHVVRHRHELRREIGLVHAHCDGSGSAPAYAYAAARVLDVPLVSHIYCCRSLTAEATTLFEKLADPIAKPAERYVVRRSGAVLTLSDKTRERVRDEFAVEDARVHRIAHLPMEDFERHDTPERRAELRERFGLTDDRPVVLYVGRMASEKGVEHFVRAAAEMSRRRRCRFVAAGDGPVREDVERLAAELGVADDVTVTGFLVPEMIPSMISLSTVAVLPSLYEELGVVLLEFMLMRRPIVAHDVSGVSKLVKDGETGLLVAPCDPPQMADAIERLLDDPQLSRRLTDAAAPIPYRDYSLAAVGAQLETIYEHVMQEAR